MCICGHAKSQHNGAGKVCDYAGHPCQCTGYKASPTRGGFTLKACPATPMTLDEMHQQCDFVSAFLDEVTEAELEELEYDV